MRAPAVIAALVIAPLGFGCAARDTSPIPDGPSAPRAATVAPATEAAARGKAIAQAACAGCHAVGLDDRSALAAAPPFRSVARTRSLDEVETAMSQGLMTGHPAMPLFTFRAGEIDDLIAYLDTLRQDRPDRAPAVR